MTDVQQTLEAAEVTVSGTFVYRDSQRHDQRQPVSFHASLERAGGAWRITSIR